MTTKPEPSDRAEVEFEYRNARGRVEGNSNTVVTITAVIGIILLSFGVLWVADRALSRPAPATPMSEAFHESLPAAPSESNPPPSAPQPRR